MIAAKIYIETYGCALNKADSLTIKKLLVEGGYEVVDSIEEADVIIINTCAVRYDTEVRMFKRIEQLLRLGKKLIVSGCLTRIYPYKLRTIDSNLSILSPQSIDKVLNAVEAQKPVAYFDEVKKFKVLPEIVEGVKATIPVAEGCLDDCSFCVVKVARPRLSSVPIDKVVEVVEKVLDKGAVEIELTAQDLAVYGYDLYGKYSLPNLLERILELEKHDFVLRLGQMNPRHLAYFVDCIIEVLKDPRVYKHLHIPIQSGSNKVLNYMNRGHNVELFLDMIKEIRSKIEGVSIATDIIVGYPGEDEEAFLESVKLLIEYQIDRVHIARFSPRPQTKAALITQIPDPIKKMRSSYIEKAYEAVALNLNTEYIGSIAKVWITELDKERGRAIGRLYNYRPVVLDVGFSALGKQAYARIEEATFYDLRGRIVNYI